jgi:hypothetical protein
MRINQLIPKFIKERIYKVIHRELMTSRANLVNKIPKIDLEKRHISNTKLLESREVLLEQLTKNGIGAEIGVDQGTFTQKILEISSPKKLHLVDIWSSKRYDYTKQNEVFNKFEHEISAGSIEINIGYSTIVAKDFPNNYFDWIYIDTDHSYETTINELYAYQDKLKEGGIIAGHDYIQGYWIGMVKYGVVEAVAEFCKNNNWEILFLTTELNENPSFAIRKISN